MLLSWPYLEEKRIKLTNFPKILTFQMNHLTSNDCNILNNHAIQLATLSKDSFWIDFTTIPRCPLEVLAYQILNNHIKILKEQDTTINTTTSGAEWWIQVKDITRPNDNLTTLTSPTNGTTTNILSTSADLDDSMATDDNNYTTNNGIDLHYDKDEEIAEAFNVGVFPTLSTVTYLSPDQIASAPTVIFDTTASDPVGSDILSYTVSYPRQGKHLIFEGSLLHGAPSSYTTQSEGITLPLHDIGQSPTFNKRITFLVNIWAGHHPCGVQPLPINLLTQLPLSHMSATYTSDTPNETAAPAAPAATAYVMQPLHMTPLPIEPIKVTKKDLTRQPDCWTTLPFVTETSAWGKDEDETGLLLGYWEPPLLSTIGNDSGNGSSHSSSTSASTYQVVYPARVQGACLRYEEDGEGMDEFCTEIGGVSAV